MMINKTDSTIFNGKIQFARPKKWNKPIMEACKNSPYLNKIANTSDKDLWLDLSKKQIEMSNAYKIYATFSDSQISHFIKRIFGISASLTRTYHRAENIIYNKIPSLDDKYSTRRNYLNRNLGLK